MKRKILCYHQAQPSVYVHEYVTMGKKNLCCYMYPGFTLELPRIILTCATPDNKFLYLVKLLPPELLKTEKVTLNKV